MKSDSVMKAAVLYKPREIKFEDREMPRIITDTDVLVEVRNVGICHSDVHYYVHGRIGDFLVKEPLVLGHECSGVIIDKHPTIKHLEIGDRVIIEPAAPCRTCEYCKVGRYNICENLKFMGTPPTDGAFREYFTWPSDFIYKMPDTMSLEEGALIEPFSVALYSVRRSGLSPGDRVAILGAGTIGLMTLLATLTCGSSEVFITDIVDSKLRLAEELGATAAINANKEDPVKTIKYLTNGKGPDIVFDAVGIERTFTQALNIVKIGGKVVIIGLGFEDLTTSPIINIPCKEINVLGILRYANVFPQAIRLVASKKLPLTKLITHRLNLSELVKGMEMIVKGEEDVIKVMIKVR
jgi:L-iditol 2-dehydrogenase